MNQIHTFPFRRAFAVLLALALLPLLLAPPARGEAAEEGAGEEVQPPTETVYLSTAEDLLRFAEACALDRWSQGKLVVLERDISLTGVEFRPIPGFGGVFDGRNHTITGLELSGSYAQAGFFAVVRSGAVVQNLTVSGDVDPSGDSASVGGLVGENQGRLRGCTFLGSVRGERQVGGLVGLNTSSGVIESSRTSGGVYGEAMTGGVAGCNYGEITGCSSECFVNTQSSDPALSLGDLDVDLNSLFARGTATNALHLVTDSGGIAGRSTGTLRACTNYGAVGYPHTGYNVGGIVGISSGYVIDCVNRGSVYGRKDVGGVAGQAEPHVEIIMAAEAMDDLHSAIDELGRRVDSAVAGAEGSTAVVTARLNAVQASVSQASDSAKALSDSVLSYGDTAAEDFNQTAISIAELLPRLRAVAEELITVTDSLSTGLGQADTAVQDLENADPAAGETIAALRRTTDSLRNAVNLWEAAGTEMGAGLQMIHSSASVDPEHRESYDAAMEDLRYQWNPEAAGDGDRGPSLAWYQKKLSEDLRNRNLLEVLTVDIPGIKEAQNKASEDLAAVSEALRFDSDEAKLGLDEVVDSFRILEQGRPGVDSQGIYGYFNDAIWALSDTYPALDAMAGEGRAAMEDLDAALWSFAASSDALAGALRDSDGILETIEDTGTAQITPPGESLGDASGDVYHALESVGSQLGLLNGDLSGATGTLLSSLRSVNNQMTAVMDLLAQAVDEAGNRSAGDLVADVSEEELDSVTLGKLRNCFNYGEISGDLAVGGIAGTLGVDDALDPEGDAASLSISSVLRRQYALKAILQECVNRGKVAAKRDFAGCICGNMELGLITGCQAYGSAESLNGSYVGGQAGWSLAVIRDSWSKCVLAGERYVGGILGGGRDCTVTGCTAMVEISHSVQYAGAVAGAEAGTIERNRFVSDSLAGIDRYSYQGRAEPVEYVTLASDGGLPEELQKFTLRFLAEGAVVKEVAFDYGDSFGPEVFPDIPQKAGYFGTWDRSELTDLRFDTTVNADYEPLRIAISSVETRADGRPVFLAEGSFDGDAAVQAGSADILALSDAPLIETWRVTIPADGAERHILRYLPPDNIWNYELRQLGEKGWEQVISQSAGSYLLLEVQGNETVLALVQKTVSPWMGFLLGGATGLVFMLLVIVRIHAIKRRKQAAAGKAPAPADAEAPDTAGTHAQADGAAPVLTPEEAAAAAKAARRAARRSRRRKVRVTLLVLLFLAGGAIAVVAHYAPGLIDGAAAYSMLRLYLQRSEADMSLTVELPEGERQSAEVELFWRDMDGGKRISGADFRDFTVYYADGVLLLENGQAFSLNALAPDRSAFAARATELFRFSQVERETEEELSRYRLILTEGQLQALEDCLPELTQDYLTGYMAKRAKDAEAVLELTATEGRPEALTVTLSAPEGGETYVRAQLRLNPTVTERTLPAEVQTAVASGTYYTAAGDWSELLYAWLEFSHREYTAFRTELRADCGPLTVRESPELGVAVIDGRELSCLRSNLFSLYFMDGKIYTAKGQELTDRSIPLAAALPGIAGTAMTRGEIHQEARDGGTAYSLTLDEDAIADTVYSIAPAARDLSLSFEEGKAEILVVDGAVARFSLICTGQVRVAGLSLSAAFSAELTPDDSLIETFTFPEGLIALGDEGNAQP